MKKIIFIVITALVASFVLVSCKTNEDQSCLTVIAENGAFTVSDDSQLVDTAEEFVRGRITIRESEPLDFLPVSLYENIDTLDIRHLSESTDWSWGEPITIHPLDKMDDFRFVSPYKVVYSFESYIYIISTEETVKRSVLFVEKETGHGVISGYIIKDIDHDGNIISESHQRDAKESRKSYRW